MYTINKLQAANTFAAKRNDQSTLVSTSELFNPKTEVRKSIVWLQVIW